MEKLGKKSFFVLSSLFCLFFSLSLFADDDSAEEKVFENIQVCSIQFPLSSIGNYYYDYLNIKKKKGENLKYDFLNIDRDKVKRFLREDQRARHIPLITHVYIKIKTETERPILGIIIDDFSEEELLKNENCAPLSFEVSREREFEGGLEEEAIIKRLNCINDELEELFEYHLLFNNCVGFVYDLIDISGLTRNGVYNLGVGSILRSEKIDYLRAKIKAYKKCRKLSPVGEETK